MARKPLLEAAPEADRIDDTPHPRETQEFFGHREAEQGLLNAYRAGRLPQAYVIGGQQGIGKATLAWRLARFLLVHPDPASQAVQHANDLSIGAHDPVMHKVAALSHGDVVLLRREWNEKSKRHYTEIRVDDVRQASHLFRSASAAGGYRICIVDSADDLNNSAANALLKLVEEPPPRSLFLIVSHRPALLLPTLRSRSQMLTLRPLETNAILRVIETLGEPWTEASEAERRIAAERAQGSIATALSLLADEGIALDNQVRALARRVACARLARGSRARRPDYGPRSDGRLRPGHDRCPRLDRREAARRGVVRCGSPCTLGGGVGKSRRRGAGSRGSQSR